MNMPSIDAHTMLCGIIGNPVKHSLSPDIHNAGYAAQGLNYVYLAFEVEDVAGVLAGMRAMPNFRGLSVTIPHKQTVIPLLDELTPIAEKVGSVNTVIREADGRLVGHSTDGLGTLRAFSEAGVSLKGKRVLFLGTGGAVRAVTFAFADEGGVAGITLLGRTPAKVAALGDDLIAKTACPIAMGSLTEDLEAALTTHDVIVQGTPLGMAPEHEGESPVPKEWLRPEHVVFDMVYKPLRTKLIQDAEAKGCNVILGTEMLLHQATLQYECWTGEEAPVDAMRTTLAGNVN
jgi:shikimate dehydrogenase